MSEKPNKIEFKILDYKRLENDFVSFELEDWTVVKVKVDLDRVGKAANYKNPDGTPHYAISTAVKLSIIPPDKKFSVEKKSVKGTNTHPPGQMFSWLIYQINNDFFPKFFLIIKFFNKHFLQMVFYLATN